MMKINSIRPEFLDQEFNILDYGAKSSLTYNNREAIQKAIDECSFLGGGKVYIPQGYYLTGPIRFKDNVNLYLDQNAFVKFTKTKEEYPLIWTEYEGETRIRTISPISAYDCKNIAITGQGILDGSGDLWREVKQSKVSSVLWEELLKKSSFVVPSKSGGKWCPSKSYYQGILLGEPEYTDPKALEKAEQIWDYFRPVFVSLVRCDKILIEGVTIQNSPAWNIHPLYCKNFSLIHTHIKNVSYAQNGDGIDLESCENCEIAHSYFEVGDDGICLKSGKNRLARKINAPTQNVWIHDCKVFNAHGGFVVGSEMSRGVRNILVENCVFSGSDVGIRFKSAMGRGGVVEDILIKNIIMSNIKEEAILFTFSYVFHNPTNPNETKNVTFEEDDIPEFRNIKLKSIFCDSAKYALKIEGLEVQPIHDITIENTEIHSQNEISLRYCKNIQLKHVRIYAPHLQEFDYISIDKK